MILFRVVRVVPVESGTTSGSVAPALARPGLSWLRLTAPGKGPRSGIRVHPHCLVGVSGGTKAKGANPDRNPGLCQPVKAGDWGTLLPAGHCGCQAALPCLGLSLPGRATLAAERGSLATSKTQSILKSHC